MTVNFYINLVENFIKFRIITLMMGRSKKKLDSKNRTLNAVFKKIEKDKKKKLLNFVSDITEESLKGISKPKLRLNKFPKKN